MQIVQKPLQIAKIRETQKLFIDQRQVYIKGHCIYYSSLSASPFCLHNLILFRN